MNTRFRFLALAISCWLVAGGAAAFSAGNETIYYAVESKGVQCGFGVTTLSREVIGGRDTLVLDSEVRVKLTLGGAPVEMVLRFKEHVEPESGQFRRVESEITQGQGQHAAVIEVAGGEARVTSRSDGRTRTVPLPEGVILENSLFYPHLVRDFVAKQQEQQTYQIFDSLDGNLHETTYTRIGTEKITLAGKEHTAIVLDELDRKTGEKARWWIDAATGRQLRADYATRSIILADASVRDKIQAVKIDDRMLTKVGVAIPNVTDLSYMKVKASLTPTGAWITPDGLNVPGQRFSGTVQDNRIEGVFEINHPRYKGRNAPPFPPDFAPDAQVSRYLQPEDLVESHDPLLTAKAREISAGAGNSWEAATRLAKWVAEEIQYTIPGGVSARNTFDLKTGECGAHSRLLAAFCRAVGIPARVVWGCMYLPNGGGAFAQHGWNEVFMGEAGWVPLDTTVHEIDFVDSGHIRLGILASKVTTAFGPEKMEILDYRTDVAATGTAGAPPAELQPYLGDYTGRRGPLRILYQKGGLLLDIPGKVTLELNGPDPDGVATCKMTNQVSVAFRRDGSGRVVGMALRSKTPLPRSPAATAAGEPIPAEFRPHTGVYPIPGQGAEFKVAFEGGGLVLHRPGQQAPARLQGPDPEEIWTDESGRIRISFVRTEAGGVSALVIHESVETTKVGAQTAEERER